MVKILEVESESRDGLLHISLRGELDLSTVPQVQEALQRAEAGSPALMLLDLSKLSFLDSTGLRTVITAADRAHEADRRFIVVRGPEAVQRVFSITRIDERLEMVDDASAVGDGV